MSTVVLSHSVHWLWRRDGKERREVKEGGCWTGPGHWLAFCGQVAAVTPRVSSLRCPSETSTLSIRSALWNVTNRCYRCIIFLLMLRLRTLSSNSQRPPAEADLRWSAVRLQSSRFHICEFLLHRLRLVSQPQEGTLRTFCRKMFSQDTNLTIDKEVNFPCLSVIVWLSRRFHTGD